MKKGVQGNLAFLHSFSFRVRGELERKQRLLTYKQAQKPRRGAEGGGSGAGLPAPGSSRPPRAPPAGRGRGMPPREGRADARLPARPLGVRRRRGRGSREGGWQALGSQPRSLGPLALPRRARPASCEALALRPLPPLPSLPPSRPLLLLLPRPLPLPGAPSPAGADS